LVYGGRLKGISSSFDTFDGFAGLAGLKTGWACWGGGAVLVVVPLFWPGILSVFYRLGLSLFSAYVLFLFDTQPILTILKYIELENHIHINIV
jgi:hypothetical protein